MSTRTAQRGMPKADWIVAGNTPSGGYYTECLRCHAREDLRVPCSVESFILRMKAFAVDHKDCRVQPGGAASGTGEPQ